MELRVSRLTARKRTSSPDAAVSRSTAALDRRSDEERGRERRRLACAPRSGGPHRRDGDHLRGREHRRDAQVHRGGSPGMHARGGAPAPDARTRSQRPRGSGRPGAARGEGSVGLRDGRRPAAPTRADSRRCSSRPSPPTSTSSSRAATARTARPASAGRARWRLAPPRAQRGCCFRGAFATSRIP